MVSYMIIMIKMFSTWELEQDRDTASQQLSGWAGYICPGCSHELLDVPWYTEVCHESSYIILNYHACDSDYSYIRLQSDNNVWATQSQNDARPAYDKAPILSEDNTAKQHGQ